MKKTLLFCVCVLAVSYFTTGCGTAFSYFEIPVKEPNADTLNIAQAVMIKNKVLFIDPSKKLGLPKIKYKLFKIEEFQGGIWEEIGNDIALKWPPKCSETGECPPFALYYEMISTNPAKMEDQVKALKETFGDINNFSVINNISNQSLSRELTITQQFTDEGRGFEIRIVYSK